jgi:hypothetical protein
MESTDPAKTFTPSDSTTYTYQQKALTIPQGDIAQSLEELGINLLVGGLLTNKIYPWDRSSFSFTLPVSCAEKGIYKMKNINSTVYVLAGVNGNIYKTNGSFIQFVRRVPEYLMSNIILTWGGVDSQFGHLVFGIGTNSQNSYYGMWRLTPDGVLTLDNQPAAGAGNVTAILSQANSIFIGSSGAFDYLSSGNQAAFNSIVQSELLPLGTKTKPEKISEIELQMANSTGSDQIRISYRRDLNPSTSFTTITTFTMNGQITSFKVDAGISDIENIQFQIEFGGTAQIFELRLFP